MQSLYKSALRSAAAVIAYSEHEAASLREGWAPTDRR